MAIDGSSGHPDAGDGHRIDGQNAVIPPSRPAVTYPRKILPKHALGISITVNLFQLALHRLEANWLAMSRQTFIFVSAPAQDADLMHLIEQVLGRQFIREEGSDPYIRVGTVAVYLGGHEFDDDDIAWPQGSDIPLQSEYPAMIEVRDTGGDLQRQQEIASEIFAALRSAGRYRAVYIDDMQQILDGYNPEE
jgi:hypothetical protein